MRGLIMKMQCVRRLHTCVKQLYRTGHAVPMISLTENKRSGGPGALRRLAVQRWKPCIFRENWLFLISRGRGNTTTWQNAICRGNCFKRKIRTGHRRRITVGRSHGASEALVCSGTGRPMRIWRFVAWMPHRGRLRSKTFAAKGCWMKWRWKAFASHCICSHGIFLCLRKLAPQNPFRPAVHLLRLWTICCGIAN